MYSTKTMYSTSIWNKKSWPENWTQSEFAVLPKKGDVMQCCHNRTIAQISHASKIMLKIIGGRLKSRLDSEIAVEQAGFRSGKGTRDQILNLKLIMEKYRERQRKLYICFIDYSKTFDMVIYERLWAGMCRMGFPSRIVQLLRCLYLNQRATVRTGFGNSDWFEIGKGVRQRCVLSPQLFNVFTELIMREALGGFTGTVSLGGKICTNLRYADDVALLAGSIEELQRLLDRVRLTSEEGGLFLNVTKSS